MARLNNIALFSARMVSRVAALDWSRSGSLTSTVYIQRRLPKGGFKGPTRTQSLPKVWKTGLGPLQTTVLTLRLWRCMKSINFFEQFGPPQTVIRHSQNNCPLQSILLNPPLVYPPDRAVALCAVVCSGLRQGRVPPRPLASWEDRVFPRSTQQTERRVVATG